MKILMLTARMGIGGAETHILELSRGLIGRGHFVTVGSSGGVYRKELKKAGVGTVYLPLDDRRSLPQAVRAIRELLKREQFDVIHAHGRLPAFAASLALKYNSCNIPLVTTAHLNFRLDPVLRAVTVWGEKTVAVSSSVRDHLLREYGISRSAVENTVNGVDTDRFRPEKPDPSLLSAFGLSEETGNRAAMVCRLDRDADAGADAVLDALPAVLTAVPAFTLLLCGGGNDEDRIRRKAEAVNRAAGRNAVILTGPRTDIPKLVNLASVGFGVSRAAMEEMACGKPVLLIGPQGYLGIFDETKEEAAAETNFCCMNSLPGTEVLAGEIVRLFSLPQSERDRLGAFCREVIRRSYSVGRMVSDAERIYRFVVKSEPEAQRVLLTGYFGCGNTGDEAMLEAEREAIAVSFPGKTVKVLRGWERKDPGRVIGALNRADLLLIGGGSLLTDASSSRSLAYYLALIEAGRRSGCRIAMIGVGIGPFSNPENEKSALLGLREVKKIGLRDRDSYEYLKKRGLPEEKLFFGADPVFLSREEDPVWIGYLRRKYGFPEKDVFFVFPRKKENPSLLSAVCALARHGKTPVIVPLHPEYDRKAAQTLREKAGGILPDEGLTGKELIGLMKSASFAITERYHGLVFAISAGIPAVPISYDPKTDALCRDAGLPSPLRVETADARAILFALKTARPSERKEELKKRAEDYLPFVLGE